MDPQTKLMWTREDNGEDTDWNNAKQHAKDLRLGGYSDWRLPTIEELERLYDPMEQRKIRRPFKLTGGWVWSATKESSNSAWYFDFYFGERDRNFFTSSNNGRALCVRSGE